MEAIQIIFILFGVIYFLLFCCSVYFVSKEFEYFEYRRVSPLLYLSSGFGILIFALLVLGRAYQIIIYVVSLHFQQADTEDGHCSSTLLN